MKSNRHNQPLWPAVSRVTGADEETRRRKVEEDDLIHCFVWAGTDALSEALDGPLIDGLMDDDLATQEPTCRIRSLLAQDRVVGRINNDRSYQRQVTRKMLRQRWDSHSKYVADVLSFAIFRRHWALRTLSPDEISALNTAPDFAAAIAKVALANLTEARRSELRRLHFLAVAYADSDPVVDQALHQTYRLINQQWEKLYAEVLRSRGLRLKDGVTLTQLTMILTATDDGLTMRMLADPHASGLVLGERPDENLLGLVVRLLIAGCIDAGDGESVNSAVNRLVTGRGASMA